MLITTYVHMRAFSPSSDVFFSCSCVCVCFCVLARVFFFVRLWAVDPVVMLLLGGRPSERPRTFLFSSPFFLHVALPFVFSMRGCGRFPAMVFSTGGPLPTSAVENGETLALETGKEGDEIAKKKEQM